MQALILQQINLPNLPSASGVEVVGDTAYIIGDDAPYLYAFKANSLTKGEQITLFETAHFSTGRIPKALKPDLECLTAFTTPAGEKGLLVCGSGATPAREVGFWVTLPGGSDAGATVYPLSLSNLYGLLRQYLPAGIALNLEAAAATDTELLLFQRTVGSAVGNLVFFLPLGATLDYIRQRTEQPPAVQRQFYELPDLNGKPAGFSGASYSHDLLLVTASVEDTSDPVADGEVLGSFVGVLDLARRAATPVPLQLAHLVLPTGAAYTGKVESVTVQKVLGPKHYQLLLVTDDDLGGSTAVVVKLSL
ncbi:DUF6929 family protein [Hymenobacter jejuensis]|uniref:Uncharacterized protein n=1 Tax=Hymenobacter jejuensis TaxID=2502781 RepID=A0A5B7ZVK4_9BACT|nr:hypothetical protein [Hymenobacter jejuensis]QDA59121.1 hypothetical protein FHG12_02935 [Hymenobacter jejuensis]